MGHAPAAGHCRSTRAEVARTRGFARARAWQARKRKRKRGGWAGLGRARARIKSARDGARRPTEKTADLTLRAGAAEAWSAAQRQRPATQTLVRAALVGAHATEGPQGPSAIEPQTRKSCGAGTHCRTPAAANWRIGEFARARARALVACRARARWRAPLRRQSAARAKFRNRASAQAVHSTEVDAPNAAKRERISGARRESESKRSKAQARAKRARRRWGEKRRCGQADQIACAGTRPHAQRGAKRAGAGRARRGGGGGGKGLARSRGGREGAAVAAPAVSAHARAAGLSHSLSRAHTPPTCSCTARAFFFGIPSARRAR